ncbi:MAG: hypothetical protein P1V20_21745 [Verrucomicrobiales bacterium]|nr:hypothetical protein [Verrucomicrobiales bacterium]
MKPREKILLTVFLLTLLLLGGGIGFDLFKKSRTALIEEKWALELKLVEYETLLEEEPLWKSRNNWLEANQPAYTTRDAVDNHIFSTIKNPPQNVTVSEIKLIEGRQNDSLVEAGAQVVAEGTLPDVFGWLYQLQTPENFFVIENLKVIPDKKTLDVIRCEFELLRWYAPAS